MDVRLLGPVEVSIDGRPVAIGAAKPRGILAMLALGHGSPVPAQRLMDGLWGDDPPPTAAKLVQVYVSHLRKALGAAGDPGAIVTRGRGYELRLRPDAIDVVSFERLLAAGRPREALALWRGPPLDDVADQPFAVVEVRRLTELRLTAVEAAIERDLDAGRHAEVTGELQALVAQEPLRERLHGQLMLALYRAGRQADALDAYRAARHGLVETIGAEPGPGLRRLHEAVLRQDPSLELPGSSRSTLPSELDAGTPLAGRDADLDRLREHWRRARAGAGRVIVVTGPAGMGKTRLVAELAVEVQREQATVFYASGAGAPDGVLAALARARAADRPALLVLDDADRCPDGVRTAITELAGALAAHPVLAVATAQNSDAASGLGAVATSELEPLDATGVRELAGLYVSASVADIPVEQLLEASGGIPARVHRAARRWARSEAASRLWDSAGRAAEDRADLRAAEDDLAGTFVELHALREADPEPGAADAACPYKGLEAFDVEDAGRFFGRERLVAEMVARLAGAPLLGILGPSGSGKSSALKAGLLAALEAGALPGSAGWARAIMRPGEHPSRALAAALEGADGPTRVVLAVDQFDEVFTSCRSEHERAAFIDALVTFARDSRQRVLVLLAIRADLYGRCAVYPELSRLLGASHVLVGPMHDDELRRAIALPARNAGCTVEPDLVEALVKDVQGEPGTLPLLSTALLELWRGRDGRVLRLDAYQRVGGVDGAVARLAERAYERLDPEQRRAARRLLLRLAGDGEGAAVVRRRAPLAELDARDAEVLAVLVAERLVTVGREEVEVAHEALLREWPRLRGWLEEDLHGRRLHQHLTAAAGDWDASGRDPGELYRGARLTAVLDWTAGNEAELNALERRFLAESRAAGERSHRRLRGLLAGVAGLLVVAVLAGLMAVDQRATARQEARAAEAERLGTRALVERDLDDSLLLARQGVALDDTVQTRGNLLAALLKSPAAIGVIRGDGEQMWSLALSGDERTLAAGDPAGTVFLFDARRRTRSATFKPVDGNAWITGLEFSPDGGRLAVAHDTPDGNVVGVFDVRSRRRLATLEPPRGRYVQGMRYSADGRTLDVSVWRPLPQGEPSLLTRFDARTGRRVRGPLALNRRGASPVLRTSDGARIVAAGIGETVVRDAVSLRVLDRIAVGGSGDARAGSAYALGPDDVTLAIGDPDGSLRLLDLRTGRQRMASGRHGAGITGALFAPDGRTLVTTSDDGDVIRWDTAGAAAVETLSGHAGGVRSPQQTLDGATLYTASLDGTVFAWDLAGGRRLGRPFQAAGDRLFAAGGVAGDGFGVALSPDGRLFASAEADGSVSVVDVQTLARRRLPSPGFSGDVMRIRFVPGGRLLIVGGQDGHLALVDAGSGAVLRRLRGHRGRIYTPGVGEDGRLLVTGSDDNTVRSWSLPDGRALGPPLEFRDTVFDTQLSPDGRWITVVLVDPDFEGGTIEVRNARTRRRVHRIRVPHFPGFLRFSPDARLAAVGDRVGRTRVWSTATWRPVTRWLAGDASGVSSASIAPDGRTLATGNDAGAVRLWDIPTGQSVGTSFPGVPSRPVLPFFTPDGSKLIASYEGGRAYVWDIRPESLSRRACDVAGRRLGRAEWERFLPGRAFAPAC